MIAIFPSANVNITKETLLSKTCQGFCTGEVEAGGELTGWILEGGDGHLQPNADYLTDTGTANSLISFYL